MGRIAAAAERVARNGKLLLALGGEHSITPALVRGVRRALPGPLTIVQIDAHADLRDSYQGSRYSHACAMRRALEENPGPAIQLGIRSYSREEAEFLRSCGGRITFWSAAAIRGAEPAELIRGLSDAVKEKRVYLTIDVDGLDPAVIPATGTPEPGGLGWQQTLDILSAVIGSAHVVALDCVELAPRPGLHMAEFAAARMLHELLNRVMARSSGQGPG
jgi:agmatinase